MKHYIKVFVLVIMFSSCLYSQWGNNFKSDSLHLVWGARNFTSTKDLNAKVRLKSDSEKIIINIKVEDDKLIFNDDPLHSDHVELWFSLPNVRGIDEIPGGHDPIITTSFIRSDHNIWLYKSSSNIDSMKKELADPHLIEDSWGQSDLYTLREEDEWGQSEVNDFLIDLKTSELREENIFFGLTHFGVFPESQRVVQYDLEAYEYIEKSVDIELDDLTKYFKVSSKIAEGYYEIDLEILPEALGFVSKFGVKELRFLVDVVDIDSGKRQQSLLSTSPKRKWGDPKTFNKVYLERPIKVKINENIEVLGNPNSNSSLSKEILDHIPNTFIKTKNSWEPIAFSYDSDIYYHNNYIKYLPYITKHNFVKEKIAYESETINNHLFEYFDFPSGRYVIYVKTLIPDENVVSKIFLPNGELALLYNQYDIHFRWQTLTSEIFLLTANSRTKLIELMSSDLNIGNMNVHDNWDHSKLFVHEGPENVEWKNVIKVQPDNLGVEVNLGLGVKYLITWDESGEKIVFSKVE